MKNFTIIHVLLLLLMLLTYTCASGQSTEDYFVSNTMDTIYGKIKPLDYGLEPKVQIQTADKKKTTYSIFETKAYSYNGDIFQPVKNYTKYEFMKVVTTGYLSLYHFKPENQTNYSGLFLTKMDGSFMEVPNLGFKKKMADFLGDCGTIGEKISSGEFTRGDLDVIINEYNTCILDRTNENQTKISTTLVNEEKSDPWKSLEKEIKESPDFEGKSSALEMVTEVISKVSKGEKVPAFVIDGLKNILKDQEDLTKHLTTALASLEN